MCGRGEVWESTRQYLSVVTEDNVYIFLSFLCIFCESSFFIHSIECDCIWSDDDRAVSATGGVKVLHI